MTTMIYKMSSCKIIEKEIRKIIMEAIIIIIIIASQTTTERGGTKVKEELIRINLLLINIIQVRIAFNLNRSVQ